jgi:hypothetical protein
MSDRSPNLKHAESAVSWYHRLPASKVKRGQTAVWTTTIKTDDMVFIKEHQTEREACEWVGLMGIGSMDPEYRPPAGTTNNRQAIPNGPGWTGLGNNYLKGPS